MLATLQPLLDLLDEGLRLYRRHFFTFLAIAAIWFVPVALGISFSIAAWAYLDERLSLLLIGVWVLLAGPLAVYFVSSMSRATQAATEGHQVLLREALSMPLLRLAMMCIVAIGFYFVSSMAASTVTLCIICPLYTVALGIVGGVGSLGDGSISEALGLAVGLIVGIVVLLLYGFGLVLNGATYASVIYSLQSFAQERVPIGISLQRSIDTLTYRFGHNILTFFLASILFSGVTVAITIAVGTLLPLPVIWILGSESPIAQSVSAVAWLLGLMVVLPPLPIWMALLYRRNIAQRQGYDLQARIHSLLG